MPNLYAALFVLLWPVAGFIGSLLLCWERVREYGYITLGNVLEYVIMGTLGGYFTLVLTISQFDIWDFVIYRKSKGE